MLDDPTISTTLHGDSCLLTVKNPQAIQGHFTPHFSPNPTPSQNAGINNQFSSQPVQSEPLGAMGPTIKPRTTKNDQLTLLIPPHNLPQISPHLSSHSTPSNQFGTWPIRTPVASPTTQRNFYLLSVCGSPSDVKPMSQQTSPQPSSSAIADSDSQFKPWPVKDEQSGAMVPKRIPPTHNVLVP